MVQKTPTLVGGVDGYESIFGHDFEIPSFNLYLFFNKNAPIVPLFAPRFSCYFLEKRMNSVQKNDFFSFFCTESAYFGCKITPSMCNLFARWFFYLFSVFSILSILVSLNCPPVFQKQMQRYEIIPYWHKNTSSNFLILPIFTPLNFLIFPILPL